MIKGRYVTKGYILLLILAAVLATGCSGDVDTPTNNETVQTGRPSESFTIVSVSRDAANRRVISTVESLGIIREIKVEPLRSAGWPVGIRASINEPEGEDLFDLEIKWDESNPGNIWFRESSGDDWMTGTIEQTGSHVREIYSINGLERTFIYNDIDPEAKSHAMRFLYEGPSDRINDPDVLQYIEVLADFGGSYSASVPPSLRDNTEGELLLMVLGSQELAKRAAGRGSKDRPALMDKRVEQVCGIAFVRARLKCTFGGGWGNPLCIACGGTSLACGIALFTCNFIVDCD